MCRTQICRWHVQGVRLILVCPVMLADGVLDLLLLVHESLQRVIQSVHEVGVVNWGLYTCIF